MFSLSDDKQTEAFPLQDCEMISRNVDGIGNQIYPNELQLNKAIFQFLSDIEAPYLDLHLFISNGYVSSKTITNAIFFHFDIANYLF